MRIGETIFEAKLSETDFQTKEIDTVRQYQPDGGFIDLAQLTGDSGIVRNYQLIRNFVAAHRYGYRFVLLVDARRPDLIREFVATLLAVHDRDFTARCAFVTWQELVSTLGRDLRVFLRLKYGFG